MHIASLDWNHFRTALAIARLGNLSRAAIALGINQSTASRHLAALEAELGVTLFLRSRTNTELTEAGSLLIERAEEMESAMLTAYESVGHAAAAISGRVRVVAVPWIIQSVLTPRLPEFWNTYPSIEIQLIADTRERMLEKGEVDVSLRFDTHSHPAIEKRALTQISYSVYAPVGKAADGLPWLGFREDQLETQVETWLRDTSKGEPVRLWANDAGVLQRAVRGGAGKALLPDILVSGDELLTRVSGTQVEPVLWLQVLPSTRRLRRTTLFIDWLESVISQ